MRVGQGEGDDEGGNRKQEEIQRTRDWEKKSDAQHTLRYFKKKISDLKRNLLLKLVSAHLKNTTKAGYPGENPSPLAPDVEPSWTGWAVQRQTRPSL